MYRLPPLPTATLRLAQGKPPTATATVTVTVTATVTATVLLLLLLPLLLINSLTLPNTHRHNFVLGAQSFAVGYAGGKVVHVDVGEVKGG